ncbi:MAG: autotransporter-associated beta strand repeat-containing protein, partial [Chthoniobacteraceae bacterium]
STTITVADGATLGGEPATDDLTLGAVSGGTLFFDGSTTTALTAANLTVNGQTILDFSTPPIAPGTLTALNYGMKTGSGTFALAGAANYRAATVADTGTSITVNVATKNLRWTGAANANWDLKTTTNFADGPTPEEFFTGDTVLFDDSGANPAVSVAAGVQPWGVVVAADALAYSFSSGPISGPGSLVKSGGSLLTLNAANAYSGPTVINGGAICIANTAALGDAGPTNKLVLDGGELRATSTLDLGVARPISIGANGGTLSAADSQVLTSSGTLSGMGMLHIVGGGTVLLRGSATEFTGDVIVDSSGTAATGTALRLGHDHALTTGTVTLIPAPIPNSATALELDGVSIGSGVALAMQTANDGVNSLRSRLSTSSGENSWHGPIAVSGSGIAEFFAPHTLRIVGPVAAGANGFSGTLVLSGDRSSGIGFLNAPVTLPGAVVQKDGSGTWTVASIGNVWGDTRISGGILALGAEDALPITTHLIGENANFGTALDLRGFSQTVAKLTLEESGSATPFEITNSSPTLASLTVNNDNLSVFGGSALSFAHLLTGNLRLVKDGPGTLLLGGRNTFTGGTLVKSGILRFNGTYGVLGDSFSTATIADGATVDANGHRIDSIEELTASGSGTDGFGAIQNTGAAVSGSPFYRTLTLAGDLTLGTDSRFDIASPFVNVNGGTFTLTKVGAGETWWSPNLGATIGDIVIEGGAFVVNISGRLGSDMHRIVVDAAGTLSTAGGRTNTKPITLEAGLLTAIDGTNVWNGTVTLEGAGTSNRIGASDGARIILGGQITGSGGFEKVDDGTVEIQNAANDWSGETKVSAGTLLVSGTLAGSTVNVIGGTLGGTGMILSPVNVSAGALAPGASIGTLSTAAEVTFSETASFHLEIDSTALATDLLNAIGNVNLAFATLTATDLGANSLTGSERFTFVTAESVTGTFAGLPNGAPLIVGASQFTIEYSPASVALVAVPEPGTLAALLGGVVVIGLRRFRRS